MNHLTDSLTDQRLPGAVQVDAGDNVAVALRALVAGESVEIAGRSIVLRDPIPRGHKFALVPLGEGEPIRKYGWPIGIATASVPSGAHVHNHNLGTSLRGVENYSFEPITAAAVASSAAQFRGYRRADGRVGTRNEIWILPTVGCVARTAERIAAIAHKRHA